MFSEMYSFIMILSVLYFTLFRFYIHVTASYQSETIQVNPEQLDVITEEGDRGTI